MFSFSLTCVVNKGVGNALSLEIKTSPKVRAFVGEQVLLKCSFKSSSPITESLLVDWTYRPLSGGHMEPIFHYQSVPHPTTAGKFKDRISWVGNVANGDASIAIQSPELSDNGTFICSVKNPPDVYHNIPQTLLLVTERGKVEQGHAENPNFLFASLACCLALRFGSLVVAFFPLEKFLWCSLGEKVF
uniref:Myelin protein zero like 3 n=1 Tax=Cyanistes caeruleus TaxID=156563 RepID=A0A8C0U5M9_CYACU